MCAGRMDDHAEGRTLNLAHPGNDSAATIDYRDIQAGTPVYSFDRYSLLSHHTLG
jgi:hypothetical protein